MKNFILFLLFIFLFINKTKAQFVTIPDNNFAAFLQANFPSAMVGNLMDTTDVNIINDTLINVSGLWISDLTGIQYFDNLIELHCANNFLWSLPSLPNSILFLDCYDNYINVLPTLPSSITYLRCTSNQLQNLPALPNSLTYLDCEFNLLTSLPTLPSTLVNLFCEYNLLTSLPLLSNTLRILRCSFNQLVLLPNLPASLEFLYCRSNQLIAIPTLPTSLNYFSCENNLLTSLPTLPNNLSSLTCNNNLLTSLPILNNTLLTHIYCDHNQLTSLPDLPNTLHLLSCQYNQITYLPQLPSSLSSLWCFKNQITDLPSLPLGLVNLSCSNNYNLHCLPKLNPDLVYLGIDSTLITCLPNIPNNLIVYPYLASLPHCNPTSGCPFYESITGHIHQDTSANCNMDSLNSGSNLKNIKVQLLKNNLVQDQMFITDTGEYSFVTGNDDTLEVRIDTTDFPYLISCPTSFSHHIVLTPADSFKHNLNFGVKCNNVDGKVNSIYGRFRPTFLSLVLIQVGDASSFHNLNYPINYSGIVTTSIEGPIQYIAPALGALTPTSVSGNKLSYNVTDFSTLNSSSFNIMIQTDMNPVLGSQVCVSTKITNVLNDNHPNNDSLEMCFPVLNSFDPNEKEVTPKYSQSGDWLYYTVDFQNTGNDTAFLVIIKDTLSSNLDLASFRYLASSHSPITQVRNNVVTFTFPHINLLDSFNHEPESHGWLQYKIKLKKSLSNGTTTDNKASIYFDFNSPIVTNTATNTIGYPMSNSTILNKTSFVIIYPNPISNFLNIRHSLEGIVSSKIYSIEGKLLLTKSGIKNIDVFNLPKLSPGIYIIEVSNNRGEKDIQKLEIK